MRVIKNKYLINALDKIPKELKNFLILSISNAINHFIKLFTGVINAKFLTPYLYGINTFSNTLNRYTNYTHLGAQNGLNRQIPIDIGAKEESNLFINLMSLFWFLTFISIFFIFLTTLIYFNEITIPSLPKEYLYEAMGICITGLFSTYFTSYLVSTRNYKILSNLKLVIDTSLTLITVALVYFFKLHGLFIGLIIAQILYSIVSIIKIDFKIFWKFSVEHLTGLIKVGFPIMLGSFVYAFFSTIDFIFLIKHLSPYLLGIYGFALTGVAAFRVYSTSFSDIISPKMGVLYGANNGNNKVLFDFIKKHNEVFIISLGVLGLIFFYIIPFIIDNFLPDYKQSILVFKILLFGAIALASYIPSGIAMTIMKKNNIYTIILSIFCLVAYLLFNFYVNSDYIINVPIILMVTSLIFSFIIIFVSSFYSTGQLQFKFLYRQIFTILFVLFVIFIIDKIEIFQYQDIKFNFFEMVLKLILCESIFIIYLTLLYKKVIYNIISKSHE